jgi:hypothetical protein
MSSISRRKLIIAGAAAGAARSLPRFLSKDVLGTPVVFAATSGVSYFLTVSPASSSSSVRRLDQIFPGLLSDGGFQQFLPLAFLVSNVSTENIRAFSSHWSVSASSGTQELTIHHYFHRHGAKRGQVHFGSKGNHTRVTARVPAVQAGETRLVTPFFSWNAAYYRSHGNPNWEDILRHRSEKQLVIPELRSGGAVVNMSITAVVTPDFGAFGPGGETLKDIIRVSRNAEHNEAASVRNRISAGATQEQIKTLLQHHASGLAFDIQPASDLYYRVRQRQAKVLLRRLKHGTWEQFNRTIEYLTKKHKCPTQNSTHV